ncbi:MAG: hypothetical protein WCZ23_02850 [Rhodospirillaceae bacterium]
MTYVPFQAWRLAWQAQEMMMSAAVTIGLRSFAMGQAMMGLRPHDHLENSRMVSEKMRAAGLSARATSTLWPKLLAASPEAALGIGMRMASGGLRPYHRATTGNAKRLLRKQRN